MTKVTHTPQYVYEVLSVEKVTDGDTYWLNLDVGFRQQMLCHIRLDGWDTPEVRRGSEFEKDRAAAATGLARAFLSAPESDVIWVKTRKDPDNFGRWLGQVWRQSDGLALGALLQDNELASQWPTRWRDVYDKEPA